MVELVTDAGSTLTVIDHPVVADKIARLRDVQTQPVAFRALCGEVTLLAAYEALRHAATVETEIETPLTITTSRILAGPPPAVVGILRAGLVMVEAMLDLLPEASVGHIGMFRDPDSHQPIDYYAKLPSDLTEVFLVDPMLATGGSACRAIDHLVESGAQSIQLISLIGCPEGVSAVHNAHPEVSITLAALDEKLNDQAYIVPGLGDAGDRIYGTQ